MKRYFLNESRDFFHVPRVFFGEWASLSSSNKANYQKNKAYRKGAEFLYIGESHGFNIMACIDTPRNYIPFDKNYGNSFLKLFTVKERPKGHPLTKIFA